MLFNSYIFLFAFLPVTWLVWRLVASRGRTSAALGWLVAASLFFYGWWNPPFVLLIVFSIVFNYLLGRQIEDGDAPRLLTLGIATNLGLLAWFKYSGMLAATVNALTSLTLPVPEVFLPLGISFFTFQQIAYLVDTHRGLTREHHPLDYALFVSFFPQLIAGPIVHHADLIPQLRAPETQRFHDDRFAQGLALLIIGLAKKVLIADTLSPWAGAVFDAPAAPGPIAAWSGTLAYTFQIYFDFSGYSDMAMGLGLLFNVTLPINFAGPYRVTNIIDFWRTWHVTLSTFLRDYLYIPLGGNRQGPTRRHVNLMITMLLGGLWHGASWTFMLWGGLHGTYLVVNHGWRKLGVRMPAPLAWAVTMVAVMVGWVFFRAPSLSRATEIVSAMARAPALLTRPGRLMQMATTSDMAWLPIDSTLAAYLACTAICLVAPLSYDWARSEDRAGSVWSGMVLGLLAVLSVLGLTRVSEFLYFQF